MNYLEMVNEVLVRMREEEVTDVNDPENDPEQRMVCKFVNDARSLVERSHAWNALRKLWVIDLRHEKYKYRLDGHAEASTIYLVRYANGLPLQEVPSKWIESKGREMGSPSWFAPSHVSTHAVELRVYPRPSNKYTGTGNVFEYTTAEYNEASYPSFGNQLHVYGHGQGNRLFKNDDQILVPDDPVMNYALAFSQRERGEAGGQNSAEIFALAKQYLSDAISWDVTNSSGEYVWEAN